MCGRFTLSIPEIHFVAETAQASYDPNLAIKYRPRFNIAPTQSHYLVTEQRERRSLVTATWGWTLRTGLLINLRTETIFDREHYQRQLGKNRCLIPADGFFEWEGERAARLPHWFYAADRSLMFMAGIYWQGEQGRYFTILTTVAEPPVASLHDRMPVFVPLNAMELWWSAPELFLRAIPKTNLKAYRVSPKVNSTTHDEPDCIVPYIEETRANPQLGLF